MDKEVIRRLLNTLLKCRDKALTRKSINRLMSLLQITPITVRIAKDATHFVGKLARVASEEQVEDDAGKKRK